MSVSVCVEAVMAKKKRTAVGRPSASEPVRSLISLKGTPMFEAWLDELVDHAHLGTRTLLLKNALREFAENHGMNAPMPRR